MMGCCSLTILCLGAVSALTAMALVAIAANTDHWLEIRVNRTSVEKQGQEQEPGDLYYSRSRGLFRVCFTEEARPPPGTPGLFLSLVEDWCLSRNYQTDLLLQGQIGVPGLTEQGQVQLQLSRATPCLLVFYLAVMAAIGVLGLAGCWQQSANKLIITAAVQLLAALVGATAMATWHAALFMEMEKVHEPGFPLTWPDWLAAATKVGTGWSYLVCWAGVCLTLVASLATSASAIALRAQRRSWEEDTLRMKLKMSSMFAGHAYYPGDLSHGSTPLPAYPTHYRSVPTPGSRSVHESLNLSADKSAFIDYKGAGELQVLTNEGDGELKLELMRNMENSKLYIMGKLENSKF